MTKFDNIYEIAADNYGLVTAAQASLEGVKTSEIARYAQRGWLEKIGRGLYRVARYIPTPYDSYAESVALVGPEAYLFGESVIAMHNLAPTNPKTVWVASPKRVRKKLPGRVSLVKEQDGKSATFYEGIPSQSVYDAILSCKGKLMTERLLQASENAHEQGLITKMQFESLEKELL